MRCVPQRDMLSVLCFHIIHFAVMADASRRVVFLNSGYLWVYGVVCLAHTVYYVVAPQQCAAAFAGACSKVRSPRDFPKYQSETGHAAQGSEPVERVSWRLRAEPVVARSS